MHWCSIARSKPQPCGLHDLLDILCLLLRPLAGALLSEPRIFWSTMQCAVLVEWGSVVRLVCDLICSRSFFLDIRQDGLSVSGAGLHRFISVD